MNEYQYQRSPSGWDLLGRLLLGVGAAYVAERMIQYISDTPEQRSIRRSAEEHERRGANVCADHIGADCVPPVVGGRRPDVYADYGNRIVIEEHETEESVGRSHSIAQDRDLRRWASRRPTTRRYKQVVL